MGWSHSLADLAAAIGAAPFGADADFSAVSTDTRTLGAGDVYFALKGENFDGSRFAGQAFAQGACAAVTAVADDAGPCLVVADPQEALQQFAAWHRAQYELPLLAITGSCGKTTAKDLTAALLSTRYSVVKTQGNLNNEIGCPLSLLRIDDGTEAAVIEMGANHMGEIARLCALAQPTEAAVTMVAPAHLEGFGSVENVAKAKREIVEALPASGVFYVNVDDPRCVAMMAKASCERVTFGSAGDVVLEAFDTLPSGEALLRVNSVGELRLPLPCRAHATNVLLAIAVGLRHGVDEFEGPLREALLNSSRFKILTVGPFEVIDDTYNANPASMAAALESLAARAEKGSRVAAVGDMLELGATSPELHHAVGQQAGACGVTDLFARGDYAADVVAGALEAGVPHAEVSDAHEELAEAVATLPGGVLLVKGSRGMRMERVIEALQKRYE